MNFPRFITSVGKRRGNRLRWTRDARDEQPPCCAATFSFPWAAGVGGLRFGALLRLFAGFAEVLVDKPRPFVMRWQRRS